MASDSATTEERIPTRYIKGFPFPNSSRFLKENILSAIAYRARDDDLILSSYPKTGSTWMAYIVTQILKGPECMPNMDSSSPKGSAFLELVGGTVAENLPTPRFLNCHFPYHLTPKNDKAKYIYVFRDPRDTLVSYYHFLRLKGYGHLVFDEYFEIFLNGPIPYGDYFEHLLSWFAHKTNPRILFVCYEELKADTQRHIFKIAEFLGEEYLNKLMTEEGLVEKILHNTSFDNMKRNVSFTPASYDSVHGASSSSENEKKSITDKGSGFFRKGIVGDWKNCLSVEQAGRVEKKAREKLLDKELLKIWNI